VAAVDCPGHEDRQCSGGFKQGHLILSQSGIAQGYVPDGSKR
jgi:hypothetical protein